MQKSRLIALALLALALPLPAQTAKASASTSASASVRVDLSKEKDGAEPTRFLSVVGDWSIATDEGKKILLVDGREWKKGQPAGGLADKARAIYGSRHEEFIDNVKAFAYFPYAVATGVNDFHDGEISMRFKLIGGALDQCAGILFNLKSNGITWPSASTARKTTWCSGPSTRASAASSRKASATSTSPSRNGTP